MSAVQITSDLQTSGEALPSSDLVSWCENQEQTTDMFLHSFFLSIIDLFMYVSTL